MLKFEADTSLKKSCRSLMRLLKEKKALLYASQTFSEKKKCPDHLKKFENRNNYLTIIVNKFHDSQKFQ